MPSDYERALARSSRAHGYSEGDARQYARHEVGRIAAEEYEVDRESPFPNMTTRDQFGRLPQTHGMGDGRNNGWSGAPFSRIRNLQEDHAHDQRERDRDRGYGNGSGQGRHTSAPRESNVRDVRPGEHGGRASTSQSPRGYGTGATRGSSAVLGLQVRGASDRYQGQGSFGGRDHGSSRQAYGSQGEAWARSQGDNQSYSRAALEHPYGYDEVNDDEYAYPRRG
ncbi:hypothetical protein K505DRAFT_369046 [Melanomma pulvis-pyrius CBS 109.77]|uniref:Uncharacterized protein n=1 Tax=Melanomma pulvis-pyrius CBS 109.77 TaxID=1314802 RepID=A0A6A6WND0_9PLEO|nr:hypothetical protein K505DRAFT_369046 [Melanomma pulvis-pyrius CBS 109.77]